MENFDNIWAIIGAALAAIIPVITLIVNQVASPKGNTIWSKIAIIIARIFSLSTFEDASGKAKPSLPGGNPIPKDER